MYMVSSVGSIFGGAFSGMLMRRGYSVNAGRKIALLLCAVLVVPIVFVPHLGAMFPANAWPATLVIALAARRTRVGRRISFRRRRICFLQRRVSTVVGIGGAVGSLGGVIFTGIVGSYFSLQPAADLFACRECIPGCACNLSGAGAAPRACECAACLAGIGVVPKMVTALRFVLPSALIGPAEPRFEAK